MGANSVDVTTENFDNEVIERSRAVPVLVDFWAPWCGPCRALTPVLEKVAGEAQGKFVLAKLNTDEHPSLAAEFGIRGIPNVKAFKDGKVVDEFTGALPELQVRRFVARLVPTPAETLRAEARALLAADETENALAKLDAAVQLEPANDAVLFDRAEALARLARNDEARAALDRLSIPAQEDDRVKQLRARLDFAERGASVADADELRHKIDRDPNDLQARLSLADWYVNEQQFAPALDLLLEVVQRDRKFGDDAGRRKMLEVFSLLGNGGELVEQYRRLLARALN
jgi:putative thioredoxin